MRVLEIVHGFPPLATAGTENYAHAHAAALARLGHRVTVLTRHDDRTRPDYEVRCDRSGELDIYSINNTFRSTGSFEESYCNPSIDESARSVIERTRPDVAHIHHLTGLSTSLVDLLQAYRVPTVMTLHDYWLMCHRGQLLDTHYRVCDRPDRRGCSSCLGHADALPASAGLVGPAARRLEAALPAAGRAVRHATGWAAARLAGDARRQERAQARADHMRELCGRIDTFLAPSAFLRDRFVGFGVAASRIRTWALGVDHARFTRVERTHTGPLRIGFLGSLMISKAPHVLLEAFARLPAGAATVTLIGSHAPYHGDDSYRSRVEPLLRLAGVRQLGAVPHEQIPAALASLDVLVVPSIWPENSPLVIREAFLSGLPVIASRIGGIPEIVEDGRNGRLFEPGNADALSRILRSLAEDPAGVARLRAGIPAVRTIEDDIAETEIVYRAAMQEAGA